MVVNEEGTLTIDLVDRAAKELVWRGSIAATIKEDPEKLHKQIESLVEKILKNYPPPEVSREPSRTRRAPAWLAGALHRHLISPASDR